MKKVSRMRRSDIIIIAKLLDELVYKVEHLLSREDGSKGQKTRGVARVLKKNAIIQSLRKPRS
jgi:hypothetical protein